MGRQSYVAPKPHRMAGKIAAPFWCAVLHALIGCAADVDVFSGPALLARNMLPVIYRVRLTLETEVRARATESIEIFILNDTDRLELHADCQWIRINDTVLNLAGRHNLTLPQPKMDIPRQRITYFLPPDWKLRKYQHFTLYFTYTLSVNLDAVEGLFLKERKGELFFGTQFEQSYARRVFPCFDEPGYKAVFELSVTLEGELTGRNYEVLSNTEAKRENYTWRFSPTAAMSSYLVAFAIGKFKRVCFDGQICIYSSSQFDSNSTLEYIAKTAAGAQAFLTKFLASDLPSEFELCFLIAPLNAMGMEHWGLLTINDKIQYDSFADWRSFLHSTWGNTVVHEVAHQWFGNLVTPISWEHIWLSESFTSYATVLALSSDYFMGFLDNKADLRTSEAFYDAHSVGLPVKRTVLHGDMSNASLVNGAWNRAIPGLVYRKGPMLLRMLEAVIGAQNMRAVLRNFVRYFARKSASTTDFLVVLNETLADSPFMDPVAEFFNASVNIGAFFSSWLYQPTYPIVFIDYDRKTREFFISQQAKDPTYAGDLQWIVPFWVPVPETNGTEIQWLKPGKMLSVDLDYLSWSGYNGTMEAKDIDWIYANRYGYFEIVKRY